MTTTKSVSTKKLHSLLAPHSQHGNKTLGLRLGSFQENRKQVERLKSDPSYRRLDLVLRKSKGAVRQNIPLVNDIDCPMGHTKQSALLVYLVCHKCNVGIRTADAQHEYTCAAARSSKLG